MSDAYSEAYRHIIRQGQTDPRLREDVLNARRQREAERVEVGRLEWDAIERRLDQYATYVRELEERLRLACQPCAECGHIDWRELDDILGGEPVTRYSTLDETDG